LCYLLNSFAAGKKLGLAVNETLFVLNGSRNLQRRPAGPFSFRKELADQAENELKGFVPRGGSLSRHAPMTQNPFMKADPHDTTASSAHRSFL
jgi:hypothetical protein